MVERPLQAAVLFVKDAYLAGEGCPSAAGVVALGALPGRFGLPCAR